MEFWNKSVLEKSWKTLLEINKKFNVILIGGWATYIHTKTLKSRDVDVIADFETLQKIKKTYYLKKNPKLKKYEAIVNEISVDIYVPYFSNLPIPPEDLEKHVVHLEGFKVLKPEPLLIMKQKAEMERKNSIKGEKDRTDILNLLINANINMKKYIELTKKYNLPHYPTQLKRIIQESLKEYKYMGIQNPRKIKKIKEKLLNQLQHETQQRKVS